MLHHISSRLGSNVKTPYWAKKYLSNIVNKTPIASIAKRLSIKE